MYPLRIASKSPEPNPESVFRKPTPEPIVIDDDDDEMVNPVNTTPAIYQPAERIPVRAIPSKLGYPVRLALSLFCLIDDLTNQLQVESRNNVAESSEPQTDSQPTTSSQISAIPATASTSPTSANYSPSSLSATASTLNTESSPAKSSTTLADLTPPSPPSSSAEQLAKVAAFLEHKQRNGEAINEMESAGILAFIREVQGYLLS
jgi:hypothetical protein